MQTQVRVQPRTGREPIWQYQVYRDTDLAPFEQGGLFDFDEVVAKIRANVRDGILVRVLGPRDATVEQIDELKALGAHAT